MEENKHEDSASGLKTLTPVAESVRIQARDGALEPSAESQSETTATPKSSNGQQRKPGEKWKADEVHTLPVK